MLLFLALLLPCFALLFCVTFCNKHLFCFQPSLSVHIVMALPDWFYAQDLTALNCADWIELNQKLFSPEWKKSKEFLCLKRGKNKTHNKKTLHWQRSGVWNFKRNCFCHAAPTQDRCPDFCSDCYCISRRMQQCLKHCGDSAGCVIWLHSLWVMGAGPLPGKTKPNPIRR